MGNSTLQTCCAEGAGCNDLANQESIIALENLEPGVSQWYNDIGSPKQASNHLNMNSPSYKTQVKSNQYKSQADSDSQIDSTYNDNDTKKPPTLEAIQAGASKIEGKFTELKMRYIIERDRNNGEYDHFHGNEASGSTYSGFVKDGQKCGFGKYTYTDTVGNQTSNQIVNRSQYEGQWYRNRAHGLGRFSDKLGEYLGFWSDGKKHGIGYESWNEDGTKFLGTYVRGLKSGRGMYTWSDGSTYEGQLRNNEISGEGRLVDDDGIYIGQFVQNMQHGMGRWQYSNGNYYVGQFDRSLRHGEGTLRWHIENKEYSGQWNKGIPSGQGTVTVRGETRKAYYVNGKAVSRSEFELQDPGDWAWLWVGRKLSSNNTSDAAANDSSEYGQWDSETIFDHSLSGCFGEVDTSPVSDNSIIVSKEITSLSGSFKMQLSIKQSKIKNTFNFENDANSESAVSNEKIQLTKLNQSGQIVQHMEITITNSGPAFQWDVNGQTEQVLHRPCLTAQVSNINAFLSSHMRLKTTSNSHTIWGYSKRYFGNYPRYWAYHFMIHASKKFALGTADARFGDDKYNYFKTYKLIETDSDSKTESDSEFNDEWQMTQMQRDSCYHQGPIAYGYEQGCSKFNHKLKIIHELCNKDVILKTDNMDSKLVEKFVMYEYTIEDKIENKTCSEKFIGFYERCCGTLG